MSETGEVVSIREFKKSDLDNVLEVAKKSFAEEFEIIGFDPDHIKKMADEIFGISGKIFLGLLTLLGKEPFKLFVAEINGKVVGTTMVNPKGKLGYIGAVMVHPTYRRRGIATKLMKRALNYIRKKKLSRAVLHVVSTNTSAKGLYHKLGFEKFEDTVHLVANIDSLRKPEDVEEVVIRNFEKGDIEATYDLIKHSEDPTHLKVFDFKKEDLKTSFIQRTIHFSTDKKIVAVANNKIVGYVEASYTSAKEAGRIGNIQVHPDMRSKGIEGMLTYAAVDRIKNIGTNKVTGTTLLTRQKLIEKMKQLGFSKRLEMEAMVLEFGPQ